MRRAEMMQMLLCVSGYFPLVAISLPTWCTDLQQTQTKQYSESDFLPASQLQPPHHWDRQRNASDVENQRHRAHLEREVLEVAAFAVEIAVPCVGQRLADGKAPNDGCKTAYYQQEELQPTEKLDGGVRKKRKVKVRY
jgi:hypothetical protein